MISFQYRKRAVTTQLITLGHLLKRKVRRLNRRVTRFIAAKSKNIRKRDIYAHRRAFRIQSILGADLEGDVDTIQIASYHLETLWRR